MGNWRIYNMDDAALRSRLCSRLNQLRGRHRIEVVKYRPRRSDRQNAFYWPCAVHTLGEALRDAGNNMSDDDAHEILKHKFLRVEAPHPVTGEVLAYTRSTTDLDTSDFNQYLDKCFAWLAELGIETPSAAEYREKDEA